MPRASRIVVPDIPHHIVQRGNRREPVFFCDADKRSYVKLLRERCIITGTRCIAWCLMDNHINLILIPSGIDGLRATLAPCPYPLCQPHQQNEGLVRAFV